MGKLADELTHLNVVVLLKQCAQSRPFTVEERALFSMRDDAGPDCDRFRAAARDALCVGSEMLHPVHTKGMLDIVLCLRRDAPTPTPDAIEFLRAVRRQILSL